MRAHVDDRRVMYADLFPTEGGDVNVTALYPGGLSAWHRHQHQDDHLFCANGAVMVGVVEPDSTVASFYVLDHRYPTVGIIPRNHWHGYWNFTQEEAILVSYNTQKFNPEDEERMSVEEMGIPWQRTVK